MGNKICAGPLLPPAQEPSKLPVERLPQPRYGNLITVLSIDGGGIRGLIPAVVLERLEEHLQHIDGIDARICDYFDVIAGTSTGGLIATMLVVPNQHDRPNFTAKQIKNFYLEHGPKIFARKWKWLSWWPLSMCLGRGCCGPRYDGKFLRHAIKEVTGTTRIDQTLSKLVVPVFDVRSMKPLTFTSYNEDPGEDKALLSDVCIGTSAAPTFFPAHHFQCTRRDGAAPSQFNLIDGGVAANNPTMTAISSVSRQQLHGTDDFHREAVDYKKYLVVSVGTGAAVKGEGTYTAEDCAKWGLVRWVRNKGHNPIVNIFSQASAFLVDWQVRLLLRNTADQNKYLRIQAQAPLFGQDMLKMDNANRKHMRKLVTIGEDLLEKTVATMHLTMGTYLTDENGGTNNEVLKRFAVLLVKERYRRFSRQKMERRMPTQPGRNETRSADQYNEPSLHAIQGVHEEAATGSIDPSTSTCQVPGANDAEIPNQSQEQPPHVTQWEIVEGDIFQPENLEYIPGLNRAQ